MVPTIGDVYRDCEIKSIFPYGVFVEIAPGREGLCHISELSSSWLAKAEDVFKVGDRIDVKLIEINDKGQLRLSRRILLPDTKPEDSIAKQISNETTEDSSSAAKAMPKRVASALKDNLVDETTEQPIGTVSVPKIPTPSKDNLPEQALQPQKKVFKRAVSPAKDRPFTNKEKSKKSTSKAVSISSQDGSSLVNGEAKIG